MTFLSVLQHLLQIDVSDVVGDVIWDTVEKLVAGASTLSGRSSDAERLLADGARRFGRAVSGACRRRSGQCPSTCQCVCHEDVTRRNSVSSIPMTPTSRQPSTDTGSYSIENADIR